MNKKIILLVEDHPGAVELTKRALEKGNIVNELVVTTDGQETLDYLFGEGAYAGRDTSELPALTLLDLKLPKVSGFEVLRRIRSDPRTRRLPVVILTSSQQEQDLASSYDLGVNSYIRKPIDFHHFVRAVSHLGSYWLDLNEQPPKVKTGGSAQQ
jgi:CheY-like chemotaxis protein